MEEDFRREIVQRITRNLLDIQILRLINKEPAWGYKIKKQIETMTGIKLRHGALYPLLKKLEERDLIKSQKQQKGKRVRKTYTITHKGKHYVKLYYNILKKQILA